MELKATMKELKIQCIYFYQQTQLFRRKKCKNEHSPLKSFPNQSNKTVELRRSTRTFEDTAILMDI